MSVMVLNESVSSCCGKPTSQGECTCNNQAVSGRPISSGASSSQTSGLPVANKQETATPEPLGLPTWNFGDGYAGLESESLPLAETNTPSLATYNHRSIPSRSGQQPLGLPEWNFDEGQAETKQATASRKPSHKQEPLGLPVWQF